MDLTSPAFEHGETIPDKYTCKGEDISPELYWGASKAAVADAMKNHIFAEAELMGTYEIS